MRSGAELGISVTTLHHVALGWDGFAKETVALIKREYPELIGV